MQIDAGFLTRQFRISRHSLRGDRLHRFQSRQFDNATTPNPHEGIPQEMVDRARTEVGRLLIGTSLWGRCPTSMDGAGGREPTQPIQQPSPD